MCAAASTAWKQVVRIVHFVAWTFSLMHLRKRKSICVHIRGICRSKDQTHMSKKRLFWYALGMKSGEGHHHAEAMVNVASSFHNTEHKKSGLSTFLCRSHWGNQWQRVFPVRTPLWVICENYTTIPYAMQLCLSPLQRVDLDVLVLSEIDILKFFFIPWY
jgi:hypothetical protein